MKVLVLLVVLVALVGVGVVEGKSQVVCNGWSINENCWEDVCDDSTEENCYECNHYQNEDQGFFFFFCFVLFCFVFVFFVLFCFCFFCFVLFCFVLYCIVLFC